MIQNLPFIQLHWYVTLLCTHMRRLQRLKEFVFHTRYTTLFVSNKNNFNLCSQTCEITHNIEKNIHFI